METVYQTQIPPAPPESLIDGEMPTDLQTYFKLCLIQQVVPNPEIVGKIVDKTKQIKSKDAELKEKIALRILSSMEFTIHSERYYDHNRDRHIKKLQEMLEAYTLAMFDIIKKLTS